MLGLPDHVRALLFDLDGVLTRTATLHAEAWTAMFDDYLRDRAAPAGVPFVPFDPVADYANFVDGRPRADGVRTFLAARGITIPEGGWDDPPGAETVHGLGNRKNDLVLDILRDKGVSVYDGSIRYARAARDAGLARAVVSSSTNTADVLESAGIADLFDVLVDGVTSRREGLRGKPAPDTFLRAAAELAVDPAEAAVFEDALTGVEAGRAGRFGYVVGVCREADRDGKEHRARLRDHGADIVVGDLSELLVDR